jgi:hypothetical protein
LDYGVNIRDYCNLTNAETDPVLQIVAKERRSALR